MAIGLVAVAFAEPKVNPKVDQLAHDGYWLKDQEEAYKPAMAMLNKPAPDLSLTEWRGKAVPAAEVRPYHVSRWLDAHPGWKTGRGCAIRAIKRAFDPHGILGPGNLLD